MASARDVEIRDPRDAVAELPRRTAHALFALLCAQNDLGMPPTAAEAMLYDPEADSPRGTAQALRAAARRGYCFNDGRGYWFPLGSAEWVRQALEDRVLPEHDEDR